MQRRGVSLIEVMFAIGVIAVGLLGVLAVIPFGLYQVGRGNVADRSSRAALNAVEEFEIQGMRRPDNWIYADGTPVQSATRFATSPHVPIGFSFCIDPRFVAAPQNRSGGAPMVPSSPLPPPYPSPPYPRLYLDARLFPYYSWEPNPPAPEPAPPAAPPYWFNNLYNTTQVAPFTQNPRQPRMLRITLKQAAGVPLNIGPAAPFDTSAGMGALQADRLFTADDDLVFEVPEDKALNPLQDSAGGIRRQSEGAISWMATLVPRADAGGFASGEYTLSIVMFNRRTRPYMFQDDNGNNMYDSGEDITENERVVDVATFEGAGFAGGDVLLRAATAEQLELAEGEWIMLGGSVGVTGFEAPEFRWYRVVATENAPEYDATLTPPQYERVATLQGSDWQRTEWHLPATNPLVPSPTNVPVFRPTQATLVKGVVAVYEKCVQLETTVAYPQ